MADVTGTVLLRGEGGAVQAYDLPLRPAFADAVAAGRLVAVDESGDPVEVAEPAVDVGGTPATTEEETEISDPDRPAKSAKVNEWRAYAVALGCDEDLAAAMTKDQVITWVDDAGGTPATDTDEEG